MEQPNRPVLRWGLALLFLILVLPIAGGMVLYHQRIAFADWAIAEARQEFGFPDATVTVEKIELDGARFSNIWLGPDLRIASIDMAFFLTDILNGDMGQVTVEGLKVDISHPDDGALGKLRGMAQGDQTQDSSPPPLPEIRIRNMTVVGDVDDLNLSAHLDGQISADLSARFTTNGEGRFRDFRIKDIVLDTEFSEELGDISFRLEKARFQHQSDPPIIVPIHLSAMGSLKQNDLEFSLKLKDEGKHVSVDLTGAADIKAPSMTAKLFLSEVTFLPSGLQPNYFSPLATSPIPLDTTISAQADITWKDQNLGITGDLMVKEFKTGLTPTSPRDIHAKGKVSFDLLPLVQQARLKVPNLHIRHTAKSPLFNPLIVTGRADLKDNTVTYRTQTKLAGGTQQKLADVQGTHHLKTAKGFAKVQTPKLAFAPKKLQPSDFSPTLSILQSVTGQVSAQSHIRWNGNKIDTSGKINLTNLDLQSDTLSVKGINTNLTLSNLWPPRSKKPQRIEFKEISAGLGLAQPRLLFSLREDSVFVHEFKGQFIDGEISLENVLADPNAKTHDLTLKLAHLDLEKLFSLIELDGLAGNGKVTGKIPLSIQGNTVLVRNGFLESDQPGVLQFNSKKAQQALAGGGEQVELLLKVLSNFHYEYLSLKVNREASRNAIVNLHIEGKNPNVMNARPFNLNINLEGNVDRLLETVMEGYRLSDRAIRATLGNEQ